MSYKLVPVEPTQEKLRELWQKYRDASVSGEHSAIERMAFGGRAGGILEAIELLSASPKVQIDEGMVRAGYRAYVEACANELSISVEDLVRRALLAALTPEQEG